MLCSSIKQTAFQLAYFRVYKTNTKKPNTPKYTHPFPQTEQKQSPFLNADSFSSERSKVNESIHGSRCKSYIDRSMWCECHVFPFLFWILCHWVIAEMLTVESWGSRENFHWGVGVQGPPASQISSWLAPCSTECPRSFPTLGDTCMTLDTASLLKHFRLEIKCKWGYIQPKTTKFALS